MHIVHIVIASALLLSTGHVLSDGENMDSAHAGVLQDRAGPVAMATDDTRHERAWTCVARHRYCEDDDHGGGFDLCHESYYYAVDEYEDHARYEALDRCEYAHPDDSWRCRITRCYR